MIEEPSHVKQLSLSHMFKIGLRKNCELSFAAKKEIMYDIIILILLSRASRTIYKQNYCIYLFIYLFIVFIYLFIYLYK
jgi:hypothetical protein